jgi:hypothetical protein
MKVLAIIDVKPGVDLESLREQFVGAGLLHPVSSATSRIESRPRRRRIRRRPACTASPDAARTAWACRCSRNDDSRSTRRRRVVASSN